MLCPWKQSLWVVRGLVFCLGEQMGIKMFVGIKVISHVLLLLYLQMIKTSPAVGTPFADLFGS